MNKLALAVVAALSVPAGVLAQTCPLDTTVGTVMAPGFSCTIDDKTFSAFDITGTPTSAVINFGMLGPLFTVTLARDGAFFAPGRVIFDYTVTPITGQTILIGTVGIDVSFPTVTTTTTMNGQTVAITNGGSGQVDFVPGATSVVVDNTSVIGTFGDLNSITNDYSQVPVGVPEPSPLPLLALGFGVAALSRWRDRD